MADTAIGSQVDLFATIAHAAGCEPSASDGVRYTVNVCADKSRSACDPAGDPCPFGGACVSRTLEGRTLLPAMSPAVAEAMERSHARDFAFAHYPGTGRTMTMRQGYLAERCAALAAECPDPQNCVLPAECGAAKVCGYSAHKEASVGDPEAPIEDPEEPHIARERTGGTCQKTCSEASECTESSSPPCRVNGKFCVPELKWQACEGVIQGQCEPLKYARCRDSRSECRSGEKCMAVVTKCSGCYDAAWKIRGGSEARELFDLTTNPEEAGADAGVGALNCLLDEADEDGIWALQQRMKASLDSWASCVTGSGSGHCEAAEEAWP